MGGVFHKKLVENRSARYNYQLSDCFEAGLQLHGSEVKSIRMGKASIKEAYATFVENELFVMNMHVSRYSRATRYSSSPVRPRKLLLRKSELKRIHGKVNERGFTLVPTKLYLKGSFIKLEICLAKGKTKRDKRQQIKKRDMDRDMRRAQYS